jgi:hypothetical protein
MRDEAIILLVDNFILRQSGAHDSQTQVGRVPLVFAQKESQDREAAEPGDIFIPGEGQAA